jgi:hypothetical protein
MCDQQVLASSISCDLCGAGVPRRSIDLDENSMRRKREVNTKQLTSNRQRQLDSWRWNPKSFAQLQEHDFESGLRILGLLGQRGQTPTENTDPISTLLPQAKSKPPQISTIHQTGGNRMPQDP